MANKKFWLGMLALALVFGMTVLGCGGDDDSTDDPNGGGGGTLTVTGIPSEYNGKYAFFIEDDDVVILYGAQKTGTNQFAAVQISNGKVDLPLWKLNYTENPTTGDWSMTSVTRYSGNNTFTHEVDTEMFFSIHSSATVNDELFLGHPSSIKFTNGSATIAWSSIILD